MSVYLLILALASSCFCGVLSSSKPLLLYGVWHYMGSTLCEPDGPGGQTGVNLDDTQGKGRDQGFLQLEAGRQMGEGSGIPWDLASLAVLFLSSVQKMLLGANQQALCVHFVSWE